MSHTGPALPPGRVEGLDAWRAALMVGGVLLHASSWLDTRPMFEAVALVSHTVRMGAFFAISGFVAARALAGRSPATWLRRRLGQIGPPTLFGLGVLCPLVTAIVAALPGAQATVWFAWYHLWFLVALLLYAPLAATVATADPGPWRGLARRYGGAGVSPAPLLAATALLSLLCLLTTSLAIGAVGTHATMPFLIGVRSIASYWPDYPFGFVVARSAAIQAVVLRSARWPMILLGGIAGVYAAWFLLLGSACAPATRTWGDGLLPLLSEAIAPPAAFVLMLRSSARIRRIIPAARSLADASFTIYILHVPVIAALTLATARAGWTVEARYGVIVVATLVLAHAFHHACVRRSAWLSLIFCGQATMPRAGGPGSPWPGAVAVAAVSRRR